MSNNNLISIVIPAFNEAANISACLNALAAQKTDRRFEVVVVDNNSTDDTAKIAEEFKTRLNLRVLFEPRQGRGAARAAGFGAAQGEIILSTDADAVVPANWVDGLVDSLDINDAALVSGSVVIKDLGGLRQDFFNWFWPKHNIFYRILFGHYCPVGFNFGIRKNVYQAVGGFNSDLTGMEDVDLGFRLKKMKAKIVFLPTVTVVFSGRRFKKGLSRGLLEYAYEFARYFLSGKKRGKLKDVR